MDQERFSIGIDLGTTNCALAYVPLSKAAATTAAAVLPIPQWATLTTFADAEVLPSFLYLPTEPEAARLAQPGPGTAGWIPGHFARARSAEVPGRVVHSAKSWLAHHAVDRTAPFLPWRSEEIPVERRLSPVGASAALLSYLRAAWDRAFATTDPSLRFDAQQITVTVPASFDAAAQRLTLDAAAAAGYPASVRLLEEPQAAFYRWLDRHPNPDDPARHGLTTGTTKSCVLVVDVGGGTSDFSLFEMDPAASSHEGRLRRVAVSEHLLLGGDNLDLALAHHLAARLTTDELTPSQWGLLTARCRDVKERCLSDPAGDTFSVSIPGRGSSLLGGAATCQVTRREIEELELDGFFPECAADAQPARSQTGLRELTLPYAADTAITRYLADFLQGRPRVDAILFNGGALQPQVLRDRLTAQIARWQGDQAPVVLDNPEPALAVALGAAHFGALVYRQAPRIEAGAARAVYLEVGGTDATASGKNRGDAVPTLVCVLPRNAPAEREFAAAVPGLELRLNRPVRFQAHFSTRRERDTAGALIPWNQRDFRALPFLQTKLSDAAADRVPVTLTAKTNELGLLQVACAPADGRTGGPWPLEFDLRPASADPGFEDGGLQAGDPGVEPATLDAARARLVATFSQNVNSRDKISANGILKSLEGSLRQGRATWNLALLRAFWPTLSGLFPRRASSADHEEAFLILAGFLLRPGFGDRSDPARLDELWQVHEKGLAHPGKRLRLQEWILWRRVAGGLDARRQEEALAAELPRLLGQKNPPEELIRLAGALERLALTTKTALADRFVELGVELAEAKGHSAPYLSSLGLILNRAPGYAGPEAVLPPEHVERAFAAFAHLDWSDPPLAELLSLFLRAARVVDDPTRDLPKGLRDRIAGKLERSGVPPARVARVRAYVPLATTDRAGLFSEALPPGLVLG